MYRSRSRQDSPGFTLVELIIVVVIIGILSIVAVPAFNRYVKRARTTEAAGHLSKMWSGSVAYFEADHTDAKGAPLPKRFPASVNNVPGPDCGCQSGGKCPGGGAEWQHPSWVELSFSIQDPFLYKPRFTSAGTGAAATFTAEAYGDLDCNGIEASFKRLGAIDANGDVSGSKTPIVTNELE